MEENNRSSQSRELPPRKMSGSRGGLPQYEQNQFMPSANPVYPQDQHQTYYNSHNNQHPPYIKDKPYAEYPPRPEQANQHQHQPPHQQPQQQPRQQPQQHQPPHQLPRQQPQQHQPPHQQPRQQPQQHQPPHQQPRQQPLQHQPPHQQPRQQPQQLQPYYSAPGGKWLPSKSPYSSPERLNRQSLSKGASQKTTVSERNPMVYRNQLKRLREDQHKCKQCGLLFLLKVNLKTHQEEHVVSAQSVILNKEYALARENSVTPMPLEQKPRYLLSKNGGRGAGSGVRAARCSSKYGMGYSQIRIGGTDEGNCYSFTCYFCQEELEVIWCEPLEDWTLKQGVKVKEDDGHIEFAHFNCYREFLPKENSTEGPSKPL